jgi:hypothetical protein
VGGRERSSQAILDRLKHTTINPDTLNRPTPPTGAPGSNSSAPPPVQLPPVSGSGAAHPAAPASNPLTLPPLGGPSGAPGKSPAP